MPRQTTLSPVVPGAAPLPTWSGLRGPLLGHADKISNPRPWASGLTPHTKVCAGKTMGTWSEASGESRAFCVCWHNEDSRRDRTVRQKPWTLQGLGSKLTPPQTFPILSQSRGIFPPLTQKPLPPRLVQGQFPLSEVPKRPPEAPAGPPGWGHGDSAKGAHRGMDAADSDHTPQETSTGAEQAKQGA